MSSLNRIGPLVVRWGMSQADSKGYTSVCQQLTGEIGALVGVNSFGETESTKDLSVERFGHGRGQHVAGGNGFQVTRECVLNREQVLIPSFSDWKWSHKVYGQPLPGLTSLRAMEMATIPSGRRLRLGLTRIA